MNLAPPSCTGSASNVEKGEGSIKINVVFYIKLCLTVISPEKYPSMSKTIMLSTISRTLWKNVMYLICQQ